MIETACGFALSAGHAMYYLMRDNTLACGLRLNKKTDN
jgi:hypothetical protein